MNKKGKSRLWSTQLIQLIMLFTFLNILVSPALSQGNLLIYPKRVVFEGRKKVEKLVLANTGKETAVYNISFVEYKMNENGEMKTITEPEEGIRFASPFVRVFPRVVTLSPGESQTVKVQLTNTQNLTDGEYRSHLYFRAEKNNTPLSQPKQTKDSTISIKLEPIFGLSIACIIRMGEDNTTVAATDLQFVKAIGGENDVLGLRLNRNGNMSVYGDVSITYLVSLRKRYNFKDFVFPQISGRASLLIFSLKIQKNGKYLG